MDLQLNSFTQSAAPATAYGRLTRFFQTTAFRVAVVYGALFALAMVILFGIVFWAVNSHAEDQIKLAIETKTNLMVHEAEDDSVEELARMITKIEPVSRASRYLLLDSKGQRLAGSLSGIGNSVGWIRVNLAEEGKGKDHKDNTMVVLGTLLPDKQSLLFVGQSTAQLDALHSLISTAFVGSAAATFGLAMVFGWITGLAFLRRVEAVNTAAERIVAGDLANRVPVRGTNDEFDRLSQNLNRMLDRIGQLIDGFRQVSNDIAHDLRTPLARLRQGLETARVKAESVEAYQAATDNAIEQTNEILSIFGALLRIAQIDAGMSVSELRHIDLSEVFARIHGAYASVAEDQGKYLVQSIERGVVIHGDRQLLIEL